MFDELELLQNKWAQINHRSIDSSELLEIQLSQACIYKTSRGIETTTMYPFYVSSQISSSNLHWYCTLHNLDAQINTTVSWKPGPENQHI